MTDVSIVIPAYNEALRLPETLQVLKELCTEDVLSVSITEVLVVDDGSMDNTRQVVEQFAQEWSLLKVFGFSENRGKGAAVKKGLIEARSSWVLVADADMATPWEELRKLQTFMDQADLIMGSRALPQSQIEVRQHWIRQTMGKTFNKILRLFVGLPYKDTQCGFKLVHNDEVFRQKILPQLSVERFAWDVELILYMERYRKKVLEVPIRWQHRDSSRVHIVRDSLEMLFAVRKMRRRLQNIR
ncbi:glycosyltransferase family 2 protein [Bdellovibrio bacteriovorus]|uniref:dolichyl-phosphate beta-glucosyltransferase n=1 Tax=Bdellovibrio bacteriovorus TaxID=959 RepID=UPI0021D22513|nr:dolichyl-phosphate beta-glucosyltransferase [Bdellovibrio bacteriovorus]UXR63298.1 glycosyltransferase family 2 protein [Bdellovibrio bacteriovorus]